MLLITTQEVDHVELCRRVILSKGPDGQLSARVLGQEFGHVDASTHIHSTVTFLLCMAIFPKCTANSIRSTCASRSARFWASASAEAVSPQVIEKNKKMRQAVAASARAAPLTVFALAAHRRLTFFNHVRRVYRVEFCRGLLDHIRLVDHVELRGGILPCKSQYGQLAARMPRQEI